MDKTLYSQGGPTNNALPRFIVWLLQSGGRRPVKRSYPTTEGWHNTVPAVWAHDGTVSRCWPADRVRRGRVDATRTQQG